MVEKITNTKNNIEINNIKNLKSFKFFSANMCFKFSSCRTISGNAFSISLGSKIIFSIHIEPYIVCI